jgi:hypothetical protein
MRYRAEHFFGILTDLNVIIVLQGRMGVTAVEGVVNGALCLSTPKHNDKSGTAHILPGA